MGILDNANTNLKMLECSKHSKGESVPLFTSNDTGIVQ